MRITIDGYPATLDVPPGHHVVDVVLIARVVNDDDPRDDTVTVGQTGHTSNMMRTLMLEHGRSTDAEEWAAVVDDDD